MTSPPWPSQEAGAISAHQALFPLPCVAAEPITSCRGSGIRSEQWGELLRRRTCLCPPRDSTESTVVPRRAPCQARALQAPQPLCKGNWSRKRSGLGQPACATPSAQTKAQDGLHTPRWCGVLQAHSSQASVFGCFFAMRIIIFKLNLTPRCIHPN